MPAIASSSMRTRMTKLAEAGGRGHNSERDSGSRMSHVAANDGEVRIEAEAEA